jgi:high-affinity iron transporter
VKESGLRPAPVRDPRVLLRTSRRLPVGTFFAASSLFIALLALVLTGKGMQALQEAGWLATTRLDGNSIETVRREFRG